MTTGNSTTWAPAATAHPDRIGERMSRKQFNSFLYDLYGCDGKNDVTADAVYEAEDHYVEVFMNSPAGLMIALHHGVNCQLVDVLRPRIDAVKALEDAKAITRPLLESVAALGARGFDKMARQHIEAFRAEADRQAEAAFAAAPDHLKPIG